MDDGHTPDEPAVDPLVDISDDYIASRVVVTLECGYCGEAVGDDGGIGKKVYTHGCVCDTTSKILIRKEVVDSPYDCPRPECGTPFRTEGDLRQHMRDQHDVIAPDRAAEILDEMETDYPEKARQARDGDGDAALQLVVAAYNRVDDPTLEDSAVLNETAQERYPTVDRAEIRVS